MKEPENEIHLLQICRLVFQSMDCKANIQFQGWTDETEKHLDWEALALIKCTQIYMKLKERSEYNLEICKTAFLCPAHERGSHLWVWRHIPTHFWMVLHCCCNCSIILFFLLSLACTDTAANACRKAQKQKQSTNNGQKYKYDRVFVTVWQTCWWWKIGC